MYKIENIVSNDKNSIKCGPFGSSLKKEFFVSKGYKVYGQEQVIRDDFKYGNYYIDENKYNELSNYSISSGDILISLVGTLGKVSIVPKEFESGIINPRLIKITLDSNKVNPVFFKKILTSTSIIKQIEQNSHGGTMNIINLKIVKSIKLPLPTLTLQNHFASTVEKIEEQKSIVKKGLDEAKLLFDSLMSYYFD